MIDWHRCSHGKAIAEPCIDCEIVLLEDVVPRLEERAKRNRERLDHLHAMRAALPTNSGREP